MTSIPPQGTGSEKPVHVPGTDPGSTARGSSHRPSLTTVPTCREGLVRFDNNVSDQFREILAISLAALKREI